MCFRSTGGGLFHLSKRKSVAYFSRSSINPQQNIFNKAISFQIILHLYPYLCFKVVTELNMKCFILLSFLSLAVAFAAATGSPAATASQAVVAFAAANASPAATASQALRAFRESLEFRLAMQRGRRLDEMGYQKMTCSKNVTGVLVGGNDCASDSLEKGFMIFPQDSCITIEDTSQKFSVNGNQITHSLWSQNSCDGAAGTSYTIASEACYGDTLLLKVYQGEGIEWDSHGKKSDCSDVKPFLGGVKLVSGKCIPSDDGSAKVMCSSDHKSITHKQYSDGACSNEKVSEERKDGECFASPAAKTVPFWFRTVFVILAAVVSLH